MAYQAQIWIVDFGSQYTQLITRKVRELGFSSCIKTFEQTIEDLAIDKPNALILSGGPQSIFEDKNDYSQIFNLNIPILGICYGMQLITHYFGGTVERGVKGEYGHTEITFEANESPVSKDSLKVWMSHFDEVKSIPEEFKLVAKSKEGLISAMSHQSLPIWAFQFHPEVEHTESGKDLLNFFLGKVAKLKQDWSSEQMLEECEQVFEDIKNEKVLCAFSGGVDSLVAASIAHRVMGENLYCFFVDNGLLRPQDYRHIELLKKQSGLKIEIIDAKEEFYNNLKGLGDPEDKRKAIGRTFIEVFEVKVKEYQQKHEINFTYLLQGTLYPDVIESVSPHGEVGKSVTIKSHHNVGGLPERMNLKLVEPLRFLFKDEGRYLGEHLGLPKEWLWRHPFPGPGIGIRVLGEIHLDSIKAVQHSDDILFEELNKFELYDQTWQAFTVFLPIKTVGVKGDARAYENVICLRIVDSSDGMTANWSQLPANFLSHVSNRITNEVPGITRVVYDITSKPPGTIEWE